MRRGSKLNRLLDFWVGTPVLNLAAVLRRRRPFPLQPRKIGVMSSPALGDTLLLSAVLQDLRAAYPDAEIVHCCMRPNRAAAEIIPGASRRVLIDLTRPDLAVPILRRERFDVFLDYTAWQRLTAFLSLMSGARFIAGFSAPGMHRHRGYDVTVPHTNSRHELENFRTLTAALDVPTTHAPALVDLSSQELNEAWLHGFERPVVVFHLWASGGQSHLREWPRDRWVSLAAELRSLLPDAVFALTCAPPERAATEQAVAALRSSGIDAHILSASFAQLAEFLRHAALAVSVNTGVMHLAAIAGAPTISINGPTSNLRWGPVGPHVTGVGPKGPGCGFLHLGFEFEGNPTDCMERTSVADVLAAATHLLMQTGRA